MSQVQINLRAQSRRIIMDIPVVSCFRASLDARHFVRWPSITAQLNQSNETEEQYDNEHLPSTGGSTSGRAWSGNRCQMLWSSLAISLPPIRWILNQLISKLLPLVTVFDDIDINFTLIQLLDRCRRELIFIDRNLLERRHTLQVGKCLIIDLGAFNVK